MKIIVAFIGIVLTSLSPAFATSVEPKSLKELVALADNIWGGKVVSVRMEDEHGRAITDPEAMTGPGLKNTIYLDVIIDPTRILKSSRSEIPEKISIPLWRMWHSTLGDSKELHGGESIFLLTADLEPVYPAGFRCSLKEENVIKRLIKYPQGKGAATKRLANPSKP